MGRHQDMDKGLQCLIYMALPNAREIDNRGPRMYLAAEP